MPSLSSCKKQRMPITVTQYIRSGMFFGVCWRAISAAHSSAVTPPSPLRKHAETQANEGQTGPRA